MFTKLEIGLSIYSGVLTAILLFAVPVLLRKCAHEMHINNVGLEEANRVAEEIIAKTNRLPEIDEKKDVDESKAARREIHQLKARLDGLLFGRQKIA